jgi:hypothetical protein
MELNNNKPNFNLLKNLNFYDTSTEFFFKRNLNFLSNRNLFFIKNFNIKNNNDSKLESNSLYYFIYNKYLRSSVLNQDNLLLNFRNKTTSNNLNNSLVNDVNYQLSQNFIINYNSLNVLTKELLRLLEVVLFLKFKSKLS